MVIKGKQLGRQFEQEVRNFLRKKDWFVYTKGVSTPGIDILAIKDTKILFLELKTFSKITEEQAYSIAKKLFKGVKKAIKEVELKSYLNGIGGVLIKNRSEKELLYLGYRYVKQERSPFEVRGKSLVEDYLVTFKNLEFWYQFVFKPFLEL